MLTAVDYHNYTNQSSYDNKGKIDRPQTQKIRDKAQNIFDRIFNIDRKAIEAINLEQQKRNFEAVKGISHQDFLKLLSKNK